MNKTNISIITPTLNNEKDIERFLKSINAQRFSKDRFEILILDGGSSDKTLEIARKYNVRIIPNKKVYADIGVNLGMQKARGEVLVILATDNIYKTKDALKKIYEVFKDKTIYAGFPKQEIDRKDTLFTKYINTFTDPVNHFVYGYASNPRTFNKIYKIKQRNDTYTLFDFKSSDSVPLIALAQGFVVRADFKRSTKNAFDDVTPVIELIEKNKKIVYFHSISLYHHTVNSIGHFINKQAWRTRNYLNKRNFGISHRKKLLSSKQTERIRYWPVYSLTIFPSFVYAAYHLIKDRERMWILHPFLCIISGYTSLFVFLSRKIKR